MNEILLYLGYGQFKHHHPEHQQVPTCVQQDVHDDVGQECDQQAHHHSHVTKDISHH